jgi:hypothetical protein
VVNVRNRFAAATFGPKDHLDREEPSVDEQVSQPTEDTHSTRVDEPEPVESEDEWLDDEAGEE